MKKILFYVGATLVILLAAYGAVRLVADLVIAPNKKEIAERTGSFAYQAASAAREKLKESLERTPPKELEKNAEEMARKMYPVTKGMIKGQIKSFMKDPDRDEIPKLMIQAGSEFSKQLFDPVTRGIVGGPPIVVEGLGKTMESVMKFGEKNRGLLESLSRELGKLRKNILGSGPGTRSVPEAGPESRVPPSAKDRVR